MVTKTRRNETVTTAVDAENYADQLKAEGCYIEKDSRTLELPVGTVVAHKDGYRVRIWIDHRYGFGTIKLQRIRSARGRDRSARGG